MYKKYEKRRGTVSSPIYRTWENFGGRKFWQIITDEANGEENFGELYTIRQNFPPPNFSHVRYTSYPLAYMYTTTCSMCDTQKGCMYLSCMCQVAFELNISY